jgi:DNA mismatch endonuclease (patch repair protein)
MALVRGKDTGPEMAVRQALHAAGFRYRLGGVGLPGRPDIVLPSRRAVVLVQGCYWHRHDCPAGRRLPHTRREWWAAKLEGNAARDARDQAALREAGWTVEIVWECDLQGRRRPGTLAELVDRLSALPRRSRL